jgi:pyruvate formate lyase activating enzyme
MVQTKLNEGVIFDLQGFSLHDGPGCRTLIFFKGCSLECPWCSNPEGISFLPEPLYRRSLCTFDGLCINACPHNAISVSKTCDSGQLLINRPLCTKCNTFDCVKACCSGALKLGGYEISVEDLFARINRDRQYWGKNGGITLSGGEPFAQPAFACNLLKRCYESFIHTAVETCGNVPWENYKTALPWIDWIFYDLKILSSARLLTRSPFNPLSRATITLILENARRIAREFSGRLIFRFPVIPGFNDDSDNIRDTALFIRSTGRNEINILPLHHMGREKYNLTGKTFNMADFKIPGKDDLENISGQFTSFRLKCYIGSDTPF